MLYYIHRRKKKLTNIKIFNTVGDNQETYLTALISRRICRSTLPIQETMETKFCLLILCQNVSRKSERVELLVKVSKDARTFPRKI